MEASSPIETPKFWAWLPSADLPAVMMDSERNGAPREVNGPREQLTSIETIVWSVWICVSGPLEMEDFSVGRRHEGTLLNRPYGTKDSGGGDVMSPGTEVPRYFHSVPTGQDRRDPLEEETSPLTRISFTSWPDGSRAAGWGGCS